MIAILIAALLIVAAALLAFGIAALLHLQGVAYLVFVTIVLLIGIAAAVTYLVLHFRSKRRKQEELGSSSRETSEIDLLLNDANRKLRASQQGAKTLESLPLIYLLGAAGSGKTSAVVQSGLNAELVAGTAARQVEQSPTEILNLWFTGSAALLELGASLRGNSTAMTRLVNRTRATAYRSAFGSGAAPRAAIVCLSVDQLLKADGGQSLMAAAGAANAELREISRVLGMAVPVYVIVTKLDRVAHFEHYVRNLSEDEVRQVLGVTLPFNEASPATYQDQTARSLASVMDGILYKLGEFRLEMLQRETDARNCDSVYEFPREFGKLRKNLNQYLVELCKPSQLSANPYLRGFYFSGVRARVVERAVAAPEPVQAVAAQAEGATQYLNLSRLRAADSARTAAPAMVASRVPQWTFLPRLFPEIILADKTALAATTQSAPARLFRRVLYASLLVLFTIWLVFLTISYVNNAAVERRITNAAAILAASDTAPAGTPQLRALDDLRQVVLQLDQYSANGAPLTYRIGLYQGEKLDGQARRIYFDHFRPLLLNPAQQNMLAFLRLLPSAQAASSDAGSYHAAYDPLKAYLITTSHPEKSQAKFLTPVMLQYSTGTRTLDQDQQQLAQRQFDFYANELLHRPPYEIAPDSGVVDHARAYLSNFVAETRIYEAMLADADRSSPPVDFNKMYPGSASYVTDPHVVRGAFTKSGFNAMQTAIQHPDKYAQGEIWVLGDQASQALNLGQLTGHLSALYTSDYLKEWHAFLISARVAGCGSLKEAPARLNALAEPASPLLALLSTVSRNTAVADRTISSTFQPTQALVDPNATDRLIGQGNNAYVSALSQLAGTVQLAAQNPAATTDPNVFAPVTQQAIQAGQAVRQTAQQFNVDQQMHTEATVQQLMQAPIECVAKFAPSPGAPANGAGQKMCAAINPLLNKYPFAPASTVQARLQDVDAALQPDTGALWTSYKASLNQYLVPQGSQYGPSPVAPQPVNPHFAQSFSRAAQISSMLYPSGQKTAGFTFSLRLLPGTAGSGTSLVLDTMRTSTSGASQEFTWNGSPTQHASIALNNKEVYGYDGTWAVFQLIRTGTQISPLKSVHGYRVDFPATANFALAGHTVSGNASYVSFELTGPGADLLVPEGLSGLTCATPVIR